MVKELLKAAAESLGEARLLADWHAEYIDARDKLEESKSNLPSEQAISKDVSKIEEALSKAKSATEGKDYRAAMQLLKSGTAAHDAALIRLKMNSGTVPAAEDMKKLAAVRPDGLELLDDIVEGLPENAKRDVLKSALEARFGITLELYSKKDKSDTSDPKEESYEASNLQKGGKSLKKIYELLKMVPDSHTTDNESMALVKRYGGDDSNLANFYTSSKGLIALSCGRSKDNKDEELCAERHLPDVEDDCRPVGPAPKKFNFTTLHEVGHSVDDKLSFMDKNGTSKDFGGWEDYGGNVIPVAKAAAAEFKFNFKYIAAFLTDQPAAVPSRDTKLASSDEEWQENRKKAEAWCKGIRDKLWWNGADSKSLAIGSPKRVYQESYSGKWVSYLLEARTKGITGYQFRAPGEWFAELYAAYFCDQLGEKHPAVKWLKDFKRPEKK